MAEQALTGAAPVAESGRRYKKDLGLWSVVFLATGAILGPAVGFTPVSVLGLAGPAGIFSWVIAFLMIMVLALSYIELGTMWPRAGGVAYYPARASGPLVGVLNGWGAFIGYALAVPSIIVAFVEYLSYWFPPLFASGTLTWLGIFIAYLVLLAMLFINSLRIRYMGEINNALTIFTMVGLVVIVLALLTHFHASNFSSFHGLFPMGASGLLLAVTATVYGYGGFRQPIDYAEEVKDPGRTIPKAVILTMFIVLAIFAFESFAYTGAINWHAMKLAGGAWGSLTGLEFPFVTVANGSGLVVIGLIAIVTTLIASFKDGYIYSGGAARVGQTMARYDNYLPPVFARLSVQGIPLASLVLVLVVVAIYLILLPAFSSLFPLVASALVLSYAPGPLACAIFRHRHPDEPRPYRMPYLNVLGPLAFVVASLMVYWSGWTAIRILIPSVVVGVLLLGFYRRTRPITRQDLLYGAWMPAYLGVIALLSFLGGTAFGGRNVIPFPYDSIVFAVIALAFYYIGYWSGIHWTGTSISDDGEETAQVAVAQ
ncbi:MAG: APC family permease [Candidatus Dormibacteria bacterium]|jgi:amino acid transporter